MVIEKDQSKGSFPISIDFIRCANGETHEFFLTLDGLRVRGTEVYRTVNVGDSIPIHAANALAEILEKRL